MRLLKLLLLESLPLLAATQPPATETPPPSPAPAPAPPSQPAVMSGHQRPGASSVAIGLTEADAEAGLRRLLDRARANAPALAAARSRRDAARHRVAPAGALADPMVELRLDNMGLARFTVGDDPDSMVGAMVRQELPWPSFGSGAGGGPARGQRERRRDLAAAAAALAEAELVVATRALLAEVHHLWSELYALDQERLALDGSHQLLELLAATVAARYGAGQTDQGAVLRVQLELADHLARIARLDGRRAELIGELRGLAALGPAEDLPAIAELPAVSAPEADWLDTAVRRSPAVEVARGGVAAAELAVALAGLDQRPGLYALAGYGYRGRLLDGGDHQRDPMLTLGIGVELRAWGRDKQRPLLAAAQAELDAARADLAAAQLAARAEASRYDAVWQRLGAELTVVDQALLPQSAALLDAARAAYLAGRGELMLMIEAVEQWLEVRVRRERLAAEQFAARAEIASLTALPDLSDTEAAP